jgi:acyl-CoA thioester hydrolase
VNDDLRPERFAWPIRVYYEDTDAGGVVYHASYLRFLERARTEWLRAEGWGQERLRQEAGIGFVVASMTIDFIRPARLDDELLATVLVAGRRRVSLDFEQTLVSAAEPSRVFIRATVQVACVNLASMKPHRVPENLAAPSSPQSPIHHQQ